MSRKYTNVNEETMNGPTPKTSPSRWGCNKRWIFKVGEELNIVDLQVTLICDRRSKPLEILGIYAAVGENGDYFGKYMMNCIKRFNN